MKWDRDHVSDHVRDERGRTGVAMSSGNLGLLWLGFRIAASFGLPGIAVFVGLLVCFGLTTATVGLLGDANLAPRGDSPMREEQKRFVSFVIDDVQGVWARQIETYQPTTMVLYTDGYNTGCGYGSAATGPFYCPADQNVYLDLSFLDELDQRFGAPGDFAAAYVIAHEVGHHVQYQLGLDRGNSRSEGADGGSVRFELQADCLAGVWAGSTASRGLLDAGDVEEALQAASAVGDDRLQREARGRVNPDSFTHGTSAQRAEAVQRGFTAQSLKACLGR